MSGFVRARDAVKNTVRTVYERHYIRRMKGREEKHKADVDVFVRELLADGKPIRLDLGSGGVPRAGHVGIDADHHLGAKVDIRWNLCRGIPFPKGSVDEIRSDHFIEHLPLPSVVALLKECHRVLKPGGILDFSVPHIDPYVNAYLDRDLGFLKEKITDIPVGSEELYATCFDRISWLMHRGGEHRSLFDAESILAKVKLAGFENVTTRMHDPARDVKNRYSSIYVVAVR